MPTFGSTSKAPTIQGTGAAGGGFVRQPALVGELVIVTPVALKLGKFNEGKPDERETRQLTADVVVLTGPNKGKHPGMYLSGGKIVDWGVEVLAATPEGQTPDTVLAGRMTRKPLKNYRQYWATPEKLEEAIADPGVVVPTNAYTWLVPNASAEDMSLVMAYYEQGETVAGAGDEAGEDPFGD